MFTKLFLPRPLPRLAKVVLAAAFSLSFIVPVITGLLTALAGWLALLAQIAVSLCIACAGILGSALLLGLAARCAHRPAATAPGRPDAGAAPGP